MDPVAEPRPVQVLLQDEALPQGGPGEDGLRGVAGRFHFPQVAEGDRRVQQLFQGPVHAGQGSFYVGGGRKVDIGADGHVFGAHAIHATEILAQFPVLVQQVLSSGYRGPPAL